MNKILNRGIEVINQYRGWKTNEKIVVFESDDWGAIRTSSNEVLEELKKNGVAIDRCHYMLNDALETNQDLESLFNVLVKYKDVEGNRPQFTFNTIMANPDFQKIKESDFSTYYYKPFTDTYRPFSSENIINYWYKGISEGVMYPQFHGREHVNIKRWLTDLKNKRKDTLIGFNHEMFAISGHIVPEKRGSYLAVFDEIGHDAKLIEQIISEGLQIFEDTFEFSPKTFIAPNYVWGTMVEEVSKRYGIQSMQGGSSQILPSIQEKKQGVVKNYLGKKSKSGIGYLIRNVLFEPSSDLNKDWVNSALKQIEVSFSNNRPAIIDTHRVNYIGSLNPKNRERGLELLNDLIRRILTKWPDVKFSNSEKLAGKIYNS
ncbi:hypothetical protein [Mongoliitalea daihaiensis]|uniref:hypothetical protein n=1 Tax=Mongoliitalea daihaiensis TaxID=2782006 RepID=UPI001F23E194|nr:hypothetical protein [Mongoliitalea daihaiensis]UJP64461.1 hypothetical protein IPZ59_16890 [Mongoliitalea daihaiensis]